MKYHFITFATKNYIDYAQNLCKSAIKIGKFDTARIFTYSDIDLEFLEKNKQILSLKRGAGYWLWKPYVINKRLSNIGDDDVLCYCDSKYLFRSDIREIEKEYLLEKNLGITQNKPDQGGSYKDKTFSKEDAFNLMNITDNYKSLFKETPQAWAGFILIRKTDFTVFFIKKWLDYCKNPLIITDSKSITGPEDPNFIENRHDQTVLSLLAKKWGINFHTMKEKYLINA
jgi:hypothetical protein